MAESTPVQRAQLLADQARQLAVNVEMHAANLIAIQGAARAAEIVRAIRDLIADDACAATYQSFGQYRTMLLRVIDSLGTTTTSKEADHGRGN